MEGPHPHQIVGYSALAPEERAALEAARALVDEQIERDARSLSVDLMDLLRHPAVEPYLLAAVHDAQSDDPLRRAQFAPASPRPFVKMPAVLEQAIAGVQYEMFAGLFADLNHAWLTVDHRFFMWNFEDPLGAFVQFDGLDQSIVSAALIRPPAGAFAEEVPYAVLLATPLEVTVLGVRLLGGGAGSGPRVELFHTGVRVLTDNVNMVKMVGTPSGRIFMAGADGFLYELTLRNTTSGWWAAPAAKRPCSRRLERVRHFVWSALFDANDPIIELMVDNERQVLVTLSRTGTLQLYSLGEAGDRLTWLCAKTADALRAELTHAPSKCVRRGAVDLLAKDIEAATNAPPTAPAAPLVAVSAIPEAISREVQLVVTSALGVRIFLSYGHTAASQQLHALCAHAALDPPPSGLGDAPRRADADAGGGFGGLAGGSAFGRAFDPQPAFGGAQGQEQMAVPLDGALYAAGCSLLVDARAAARRVGLPRSHPHPRPVRGLRRRGLRVRCRVRGCVRGSSCGRWDELFCLLRRAERERYQAAAERGGLRHRRGAIGRIHFALRPRGEHGSRPCLRKSRFKSGGRQRQWQRRWRCAERKWTHAGGRVG
ncbi:Nup133 N terminal like-domain-containing protein [Pavlovales sp. CCMP2436]|nr:Nup133 N terminal like-domain-containing protein [Pavlovales sp. CCMP2436]